MRDLGRQSMIADALMPLSLAFGCQSAMLAIPVAAFPLTVSTPR